MRNNTLELGTGVFAGLLQVGDTFCYLNILGTAYGVRTIHVIHPEKSNYDEVVVTTEHGEVYINSEYLVEKFA